jgi:type III secretion protein L
MAFIVSSEPHVKRPEQNQKIIKAEDFWAYQLASEIVHEGFQRQESIVHAAESAYVKEQERGYSKGLQKAQAEHAQQMMEIVHSTILYFVSVEQQVAALVFDAVKQIIGDFDDREKAMAVVRSAMTAVRGQKHIVLKVHPDHAAFLQGELKTLQQAFPMVAHIDIVAQPDVAPDACIVVTDIGTAEASISAQIAALRLSVDKVFGPAAGGAIQEHDEATGGGSELPAELLATEADKEEEH